MIGLVGLLCAGAFCFALVHMFLFAGRMPERIEPMHATEILARMRRPAAGIGSIAAALFVTATIVLAAHMGGEKVQLLSDAGFVLGAAALALAGWRAARALEAHGYSVSGSYRRAGLQAVGLTAFSLVLFALEGGF